MKIATEIALDVNRNPRGPCGKNECDAHGKLDVLMVEHSDEIRMFLDYMWAGFMAQYTEEGVHTARLESFQALHDEVSKVHQKHRLRLRAAAKAKRKAGSK